MKTAREIKARSLDEYVSELGRLGYRILAPGELCPETLERCAEAVDEEWRNHGGLNCTHVCAVIRSLDTKGEGG